MHGQSQQKSQSANIFMIFFPWLWILDLVNKTLIWQRCLVGFTQLNPPSII